MESQVMVLPQVHWQSEMKKLAEQQSAAVARANQAQAAKAAANNANVNASATVGNGKNISNPI